MSITAVQPTFAAAERYAGEWVVPFGLGRAHLVLVRGTATVKTVCGRDLLSPLPAARLWDGCEQCVTHAVPK